MTRARRPSKTSRRAARREWQLLLYVAGRTPRSFTAIANLRKICDEHLKGRYRVKVIDLLVKPRLSRDDQIVAVPTLVRKLPAPIRRIIGDFSDTARTLVGLQLRPGGPAWPGKAITIKRGRT